MFFDGRSRETSSCPVTPKKVIRRRVSVGLIKLREIEQEEAASADDVTPKPDTSAEEVKPKQDTIVNDVIAKQASIVDDVKLKQAASANSTQKFSRAKSLFEDLARTDK